MKPTMSRRAIVAEQNTIKREIGKHLSHPDYPFIVGMRHALAWVLRDNAMRPSRCLPGKGKK